MAPSNRVDVGAIGRMFSAAAVAAAGLIAVLEQPTALIWQASVILSEWGHWLALLALLLLPGWRRSWADATGTVTATVGIVLLLTPVARAYRLSDRLAGDLDRAFGTTTVRSLPDQPARPAPFVFSDLIRSVQTTDVLVDEHVYARISDLAVVPYRQTSRRALISGAPTQGTPPRRVTPCG